MWPSCFYDELQEIVRSYLFDVQRLDIEPTVLGPKYWRRLTSYFHWHRWVCSIRWSQEAILGLLNYVSEQEDYVIHLILRHQTLSVDSLQHLPVFMLLSDTCLHFQDIPIELLLPHLQALDHTSTVWYTQSVSFLTDVRVKPWVHKLKAGIPPVRVKERHLWLIDQGSTHTFEREVWPLSILEEYAEHIDWKGTMWAWDMRWDLPDDYILRYGERMPLRYLFSHQQLPFAFLQQQAEKHSGQLPWGCLLCSQRKNRLPEDWLWSWRESIGFTNWDLLLKHRKVSRSLLIQLSQWRVYWEASPLLQHLCYRRHITPHTQIL